MRVRIADSNRITLGAWKTRICSSLVPVEVGRDVRVRVDRDPLHLADLALRRCGAEGARRVEGLAGRDHQGAVLGVEAGSDPGPAPRMHDDRGRGQPPPDGGLMNRVGDLGVQLRHGRCRVGVGHGIDPADLVDPQQLARGARTADALPVQLAVVGTEQVGEQDSGSGDWKVRILPRQPTPRSELEIESLTDTTRIPDGEPCD